MAIKCFVDALKEPARAVVESPDRIPGTDKIRTYVADPGFLYSKQSDLENIIKNEQRTRSLPNNEV